jgi:type I restriction enzyme, S subunit
MDEELYELPKGWVTLYLEDITANTKNAIKRGPFGSSLKKEFFVSSGYKVYEQKNVIYNNFKTGNYYIDQEIFNNLQDFEVNSGDILISCSGTIGKIAVAPQFIEKGIINQALLKISLNPSIILTNYFVLLFSSDLFQKQLLDNTRGSAIQNISSVKSLKQIPLTIPPLPEQYRIVAKIEEIFTELDAGVELLKKLKAKLKRYRQAVLKAAVEGSLTKEWRTANQGKLEPASILLERILKQRREKWEAEQLAKMKAQGKTPKDDSWKLKYKEPVAPDTSELPELPDGWCWVCAESICEIITNGNTPKQTDMTAGNGEIPYIKIHNLTKSGVLDFSVKPTFITKEVHEQVLLKSKVYPGDVLMNVVGPPLGKVSIVPKIYNEWNTNQNICIFRLINSINIKYFTYCLLSDETLRSVISKSTATAGQSFISLSNCRVLLIPLPPIAEQHQIFSKIEHIFSVTDQLEKTIDSNLKRSEKLRQSILKQAFQGKLVPQDPNDEPAEKLLERIKAEKAKQTTTKTKKKTQSKKQFRFTT